MSVHWGIVLQNYFHDHIEQYWFKDDHTRATSIQQSVQSDSIVALSQRSEEFCNTINLKADMAEGYGYVVV